MLPFLFDSLHGWAALVFAVAMGLLLLMALWIDSRWGEPRAALHPVVWMGKYLEACGRVTAQREPWLAFMLGALTWIVGAGLVGLLADGFQALVFGEIEKLLATSTGTLSGLNFWGLLWLLPALVICAVWLKSMLSWRMLKAETAAVETALQQSLQAGRDRLSWLVSRDTTHLSESEVRESAIESLAENLNDSVVAPIFWFVLLGLPGAVVYRFANTADAMWGYRNPRWEWAGKWAARADDVLSWIPARLTAALLVLVGGGFKLPTLRLQARRTPSPNSGWPMAAMALILNVSLHKPGVYVLNAGGREPQVDDTARAIAYASKVLVVLVVIALTAILLIAIRAVK